MNGRTDKPLCEVIDDHREGVCWWEDDPQRTSIPDIGPDYWWTVTVDDDGIAWTWCTE